MKVASIRALALAVFVFAGSYSAGVHAQESVTLATFGGITGDAQVAKLFADASSLGLRVRQETHGGWPGIKAHLAVQAPGWDIVSVGSARCEQASKEGWLTPLDYSIIDKSEIPARYVTPNYVGIYGFSYGMVYRKSKFPAGGPKSWADYWDTKKFPGRRTLRGDGSYVFEAALIADGVPQDQVYSLLKSSAGVARAFASLEKIKSSVSVWHGTTAQAVQLFRDGEVDIGFLANSQAANLAKEGMELEFVWNQAFIDVECFMVPKGSTNSRNAMRLINGALKASNQAEFSSIIAYGPVNPNAYEQSALTPERAAWLPTAKPQVDLQLQADQTWYASDAADEAFRRFSRFIANR